MKRSALRTLLAVLLTILLAGASAGLASAAPAETAEFPQSQGALILTESSAQDIGLVIRGLDAGTKPIPAETLLGLLREATANDAVFVDPESGEEVAAGTPAGTGLVAKWTDEEGAACTAQMLVRGDVLGTGVVNLSQLTRMAAAMSDADTLDGVYLAAALLSGEGDSVGITDLAMEASLYTYVPAIGAEAAQEIADAAVAMQTDGGTYSADVFHAVQLKAGDIIYGMLPGQSSFYTDLATVEICDGSYVEMYRRLQMLPHPEFGYREQLGEYKVLEDTWVASGFCLANSEIDGTWAGPGGGLQYVIADYETALELVATHDLNAESTVAD